MEKRTKFSRDWNSWRNLCPRAKVPLASTMKHAYKLSLSQSTQSSSCKSKSKLAQSRSLLKSRKAALRLTSRPASLWLLVQPFLHRLAGARCLWSRPLSLLLFTSALSSYKRQQRRGASSSLKMRLKIWAGSAMAQISSKMVAIVGRRPLICI